MYFEFKELGRNYLGSNLLEMGICPTELAKGLFCLSLEAFNNSNEETHFIQTAPIIESVFQGNEFYDPQLMSGLNSLIRQYLSLFKQHKKKNRIPKDIKLWYRDTKVNKMICLSELVMSAEETFQHQTRIRAKMEKKVNDVLEEEYSWKNTY